MSGNPIVPYTYTYCQEGELEAIYTVEKRGYGEVGIGYREKD
jgi:hypothetical protein